ncbi:alpha/beta hydrolase [Solibacillus sp. FSL R7-0668]|uniref:alpha/beta fold hydrolase n=1 Tax=Solibacillus sp. FSL R7-0668 TaxID=2921688 RepID=UPI0030FA56FE
MNLITLRNHVTIHGQGSQVIVMAHGFGCDQTLWWPLVKHFETQYKIILFDYVGAGQSDLTAYNSSKYDCLQGYAQDVLEVIESMQLQKVIFIGHSVSSMIGLHAALIKPEFFEKIIMIGPSPYYINEVNYHGGFERNEIEELLTTMEMNFAGWASYMAPVAIDEPSDSDLSKGLEQCFVSTNSKIARQFAEVTFFSDTRPYLSELQIPTLIMQCANDSIVPVEVGHYLHEKISESELVVLNTRGHYPHVSEPKLTADIIQQYLQKI